MKPHDPYPHWSSARLNAICQAYDAVAKPSLDGLAGISASVSAVGLARAFDAPTISDYLLCIVIGFALWLIARVMWAGAWQLPHLETKRTQAVFAFVAMLGFGSYAGVSVTANLNATAGQSSVELTQKDNIDTLENAGQAAASYVGEMQVVLAGLFEQAELARQSEKAEIGGQGPTGEPGRGPVSRSFLASGGKFSQAAVLLQGSLEQAATHVVAFADAVAALRAAQIDPNFTHAEKAGRLKVLTGQAISQMRALLALDPARSIRTAAASIATGVPTQSDASAQSQARIADISSGMLAYAGQMGAEADRIAALAPTIPQQATLSTAERLLQTLWRTPAWTAAALLLDLCGWIAVGFRVALYQTLKTMIAEENDRPPRTYVTLEDFERVEAFVKRAADARKRVEAVKIAPKRRRPRPAKEPMTSGKKPNSTQRKPLKPESSEGDTDE